MGKTAAVVLAAGKGSRMKSEIQKQYLLLEGKPVLYYSLLAFENSPVDEVILVTGEGELSYCREEIVEKYGFSKVSQVVAGGRERYHSVYEGLKALKDCSYVLIHDGARAFVDERVIARVMEEVIVCHACVAAMPVKDTIKVGDSRGYSVDTPDRSVLYTVQTPQAFSYELIRDAYDRLHQWELEGNQDLKITDDAMVVEHFLHVPVKLVEGSYNNIKITTPEDMVIGNAILRYREEQKR